MPPTIVTIVPMSACLDSFKEGGSVVAMFPLLFEATLVIVVDVVLTAGPTVTTPSHFSEK